MLGLTTITASLAVLLWAAEPLMNLVLAAVFLRERITPALVVLLLVAVAGLILVIYDPAVPASLAAMSFYVIPLFGVAASFLLLGERLDPRQWLGAIVVLAALLPIIRRPTEPATLAVWPT